MAKRDWPDWDVYVRDRCRCVYCDFDGTSLAGWRQLQIDHLIPSARGGSNELRNKIVACTDCNRKKHGFDPSNGDPSLLDSEAGRSKLIKAATEHIRQKHAREVDDYHLMMKEITSEA